MVREWRHGRRYYGFSDFLEAKFGCKVHKVSLHAGFSCPNRDGTVGMGGCIYCVNESFSPSLKGPPLSIAEQMRQGMAFMRRLYGARKFIAYFQAFTNTYADTGTLKLRYDEALSFPEVVGLSIGTRPDCVPDETLDLIQSYTGSHHVWVEYGIQSVHDRTLRLINRGHDFAAFADAVRRTQGRGIYICAHVILGLPGETWEEMMQTAKVVSGLGIDGIKVHHLYVAKGTPLEAMHRKGQVPTLSAPQYVSLAADFLERISPEIVVQRLVGDVGGDLLVAPVWPEKKFEVLKAISDELGRRGSSQGAKWSKEKARPRWMVSAASRATGGSIEDNGY